MFRSIIRTDNAAFEDAPVEMARILRKMADHIESGVPNLYQSVFDLNGNNVGTYRFDPTGEREAYDGYGARGQA